MTTDYLGEWKYHGTVTPRFDVWTEFPNFTNSGASLIRLTYYSTDFRKILSKGFLRAVYRTPELSRDRQWMRVYPKPDKELLSVNTPEEILLNTDRIPRYYEIIKSFRSYYPKGYGVVYDQEWSISLETLELVNLPESIRQIISLPPTNILILNQLLLLLKGEN